MSNDCHRLDPPEDRDFALSDTLAPLIFVNRADTKAAQMFTVAHELAHLRLGASGLSNIGTAPQPGFRRAEVWCNAMAVELLVSLAAIRADEPLDDALPWTFEVSTLVILRRLLDVGRIDRPRYDIAWADGAARLRHLAQAGNGGDSCRTMLSRARARFARAVVASTFERQSPYRDAYRMLGVSRAETFNNLGREVGMMG